MVLYKIQKKTQSAIKRKTNKCKTNVALVFTPEYIKYCSICSNVKVEKCTKIKTQKVLFP